MLTPANGRRAFFILGGVRKMKSIGGRIAVLLIAGMLFTDVLGVSAVLLAQEPSQESASLEKSADPSKPMAWVNGVPILGKDLIRGVQERIPMTGHQSLSRKRMAEIRMEVLEGLIIQEILVQEAKRLKVQVAPAEREAEMEKIRNRFRSDEEYRTAMKGLGLTPDEIRAGVERHLAVQKLTDQEVRSKVSVTDEEMRGYYAEHPEKFQIPPRVRLRILLVAVEPSSSIEEWEKARVRAVELADRVRSGEDFGKIIGEFSDEPNAEATGGDTGFLHQGQLPYSEMEEPAFSLPPGRLSDPVRTLYGQVIFRVEERMPAEHLSYEKLNKDLFRSELEQSATDEKVKEWITGLRSKAEIKIF